MPTRSETASTAVSIRKMNMAIRYRYKAHPVKMMHIDDATKQNASILKVCRTYFRLTHKNLILLPSVVDTFFDYHLLKFL